MVNQQFATAVHVLTALAFNKKELMSSEALAQSVNTNPVVIRRIMAGLRERGYVQSEKGHGGGWTLACELSKISLRDIYDALSSPSLLAIGNRSESPGCLVEEAVNARLSKSFHDAEALLLDRFSEVTLAMLSDDVRLRLAARSAAKTSSSAHESSSSGAKRRRAKRA